MSLTFAPVARATTTTRVAIGARAIESRSNRAWSSRRRVGDARANERTRAWVIVRASDGKRSTKAPEELAEKFTTGGGGADGFCDFDDIKEALKECEGLEGARLEACYAEYGCNVDAVTDHYAKAAGIKKDEKKK